MTMRTLPARAALALLALVLLAAAPPPRDVSGRWAMSWQTHKHGVQKSGWLVITQRNESLDVVVQGDGELHAAGSVAGNAIHVTGRRMLMTFTIDATVGDDGIMRGALKIASVVKPFTAARESVR
jgi:hypothetical protein